MSVRDAFYRLVHEYAGGSAALAVRMGIARSSLLSMANPNCTSHEPTLRRLEQAMALANDVRPLEALCQEFGGVFVPVGRFEGLPVGRVLKAAQRLTKEFSDVPVRLAEILKDGKVKPREVEQLRRDVYELQQAAAAVLKVVETICERHVSVPEDDRPG